MVKGVNKTVIEVNNTGSKMFEKIVFYITPKYGHLSAKQLRKAASEFSFNFETDNPVKNSLRLRIKKKKRIRFAVIAGFILFCAAVTAAIIIL